MRNRFFLQLSFVIAASLVPLSGCAPDCDQAVPNLALCTEESVEARATFGTRARVDCETGETPTYFECWEKVDISNCDDATKICLQYADK